MKQKMRTARMKLELNFRTCELAGDLVVFLDSFEKYRFGDLAISRCTQSARR